MIRGMVIPFKIGFDIICPFLSVCRKWLLPTFVIMFRRMAESYLLLKVGSTLNWITLNIDRLTNKVVMLLRDFTPRFVGPSVRRFLLLLSKRSTDFNYGPCPTCTRPEQLCIRLCFSGSYDHRFLSFSQISLMWKDLRL